MVRKNASESDSLISENFLLRDYFDMHLLREKRIGAEQLLHKSSTCQPKVLFAFTINNNIHGQAAGNGRWHQIGYIFRHTGIS